MKARWIYLAMGVFVSLQAVGAVEARACHWCNCQTTASTNGGTLLICPSGDGSTLAEIGAAIEVTVIDFGGIPVVGMPAADFWIARVAAPWTLCGGAQSSSADGPTDANGQTTMSGTVAAGGLFDNDAYVIAAGWPVQGSSPCDNPLPIAFVSPDANGDLIVNLVDLAMFGGAFITGASDRRFDFNGDGSVDLADLVLFAEHFQHACGAS